MRAWLLALLLVGCGSQAEPRTGIPAYTAPRAESPPTLDGRLDEAIWRRAHRTETFVGTMDGRPADPRATAQIAWDDQYLYVAFEVADRFLKANLSGDDPHLWEEDCVELMFDPDGDGRNYFELQLSPAEEVFDTRYDSRRRPQPFGHVDWDSGMEGGAQVRGTLNDDGADEGYTAELRIPFAAFRAGPTPAERPESGDEWRMAMYVLDARANGWGGVGWSPPLVGDFHVPDRFGRLRFGQ